MGRWEPDSRGRLREAALALYAERGFENTTVADIAAQAGLTERTFFRHFADKREVLFAGTSALQEALMSAVSDAPGSATPIEMAAAGLEAAGELLPDRATARRRQAIIDATPELQERELIKLASWSAAIADALRGRGLEDPAASLTAEVAMAVFRSAFARWIAEPGEREFLQVLRESLEQLDAVLTGSPVSS